MSPLACLTKPVPRQLLSKLISDKTHPMMKDPSVPCDWIWALHQLCRTTLVYTLSAPPPCVRRAVKLRTNRSPSLLRNESGPGLLILLRHSETKKIPSGWKGNVLLRIQGHQSWQGDYRSALLYLHRHYEVVNLRHGISYERPTDFINDFVLGSNKLPKPRFMLDALKQYRNFSRSLQRYRSSQLRTLSKYATFLNNTLRIKKILRVNQTKALRWCLLHDVPVATEYLSNTDKNSICPLTLADFIKYFPRNIPVDWNNLQWTKEAMYSMTYPATAKVVSQYLRDHCVDKSDLRITDATANVGGNVISFSQFFKTVNAIELCPINAGALRVNIRAYQLDNITVHEGNCIDLLPHLEHDVVFFDPPWGGPFYKAYERIVLYLSGIPLERVILKLPTSVAVGIKAPYNFDIHNFTKVLSSIRQIQVIPLHGFQLILL